MCGICGVVFSEPEHQVNASILKQMVAVQRHRGPDDEGYYTAGQIGLGICRLKIIDLQTGQQPISNEDHSIWLVFNGEIYNYRQLRRALEQKGHVFRSQTDSEVIVHAYEEFGIACLAHLNGMFAFAIWDAPRRQLWLARDRLGIKPLYYWKGNDCLVFGSEMKAVTTYPDTPREIDLTALDHYLSLEYVPSPHTILREVHKLPAGHWLTFQDGQVKVEEYWDVSLQTTPQRSSSWEDELAELIQDAVRLQLVSDVPLGAFLSGGIDSSTVVAYMSHTASQPVRTFSIGFEEPTYNELPYARLVADRFQTKHTEAILQPEIAALAERLLSHLDEPLADFSIFPTYLVSELAGRSVKVVLSGDGGDELFGGYEAYVAQQLDNYYRWLPHKMRRSAIPALFNRIPPREAKKGLVNKSKRFVEGGALPEALQHTRWMIFMHDDVKAELYQPGLRNRLNGHSPAQLFDRYFRRAAQLDLDSLAQQQYVDIKTYLADDILTKVDRMSMAVSIEARVPLLDHRIVEFVFSLPAETKLRRGHTKIILRRIMKQHLPETVLQRPKEGFSIPLKHWLRGPLRPLVGDLLAEDSVRRRGYFDPRVVTQWVSEHFEGRANHSHRLWSLMVFELWCRRVLERTAV